MPASLRDVNGRRVTRRGTRAISRSVTEVVPSPYFCWSPWISRILASAILIPALPIILLSIVAIRLTSRGPGVYRQLRIGFNGRPFTMYKLRTMYDDAEAKTGPVWTQDKDPRITPIGWVLRLLYIDEFPQLVNIIKGEMALIGPRPERPEFVHKLSPRIPGYLNRLLVLPGITGLSQLNLRPDINVNCVCRKLVLDVEYIEKGSLLMDLRIYLCTLLRLIGLRGRLANLLLGLDYEPMPAPNVCLDALPGEASKTDESAKVNSLPSTNGRAHPRRKKSSRPNITGNRFSGGR